MISNDPLSVLLDRPIAFHRAFVTLTGSVTAALFLSQAVYWQRRAEEWFWKTQEQWEEETGMSRREQDTARKRLKDLGVLREERRGNPAKLYFSVDLARVQTRLAESANLDWRKAPNKIGGKRQSIKEAETTTETTAETIEPSSSLRSEGRNEETVEPSTKAKEKTTPDPRHAPVRDYIEKCWLFCNKGANTMPWAGPEAKMLATVLKENPNWDVDHFVQCVKHRFRSEANKSEPPRMWLSRIASYFNSPLDRFGQPYGQATQSRGLARHRQNAAAIVAGFGLAGNASPVVAGPGVDVEQRFNAGRDDDLEAPRRALPSGKD